jgi:hypothetical protein
MTRWQVDDTIIRNPGGEIVATITPDLRAIQRQELINHLLYAVGKAYRRGFEDGQRDSDSILQEPKEL